MSTKSLHLPSGSIRVLVKDGILRARGIPYAHAARFEKAQKLPHRGQDDTLDCTQPATICPQMPSRLAKVLGPISRGRSQSEDCLHVSITGPENAKNAPVIVYFHGGAYLTGGGDLDVYSGEQLSRQGGAIVVSVTTRLGVFGYLRIPDYAPANLGLLDQIAALEWIQGNIEGFGGNKDNVTISGQSAGGDSVFCLLLVERAKHLFHKAIIQSAPFGCHSDPKRPAVVEVLGKCAKQYLDEKKDATSQDMLDLLKDALVPQTQKEDPGSLVICFTEFGQDPLPAPANVEEILLRAAKEKQIMIGWTRDEGTAFTTDPSNPRLGAEKLTRSIFSDGGQHYHELISKVTKDSPTYEMLWAPTNTEFGATHCMELPFILGDWDAWKGAPMLGGEEYRQVVEGLGFEAKKLWLAFASDNIHDSTHFEIDEGFSFQ